MKTYPSVYLCGPIHMRTDAECMDWRLRFKGLWPGECLDPLRRDYRGREHDNPRELVEADLADVRAVDALVVYYDKPSVGTSMEIFYASHVLAKPVIVIDVSGEKILPVWLVHHSTVIVHTLEEAVEELKAAGLPCA